MKLSSKKFFYPWSREIEYFLACAEAESFVQASHRAGVQQAALTKSIQRLEHLLDSKLFFRGPLGIQLTLEGRSLFDTLLRTKAHWEQEVSQRGDVLKNFKGILKLGCHASIANNTFSKFLPQLVRLYPELKIETTFDTSLHVTKMVDEFKIDAGLVVNPVKNANLIMRPLQSEYTALWKSGNESENTLLYNPEMYLGEKILKKFEHYRHIPMADYEVIGKMISESNFVGFLPDAIAARYGLKRIGDKILTVKLSLIYRKEQSKNPVISEAIKLMHDRLVAK